MVGGVGAVRVVSRRKFGGVLVFLWLRGVGRAVDALFLKGGL